MASQLSGLQRETPCNDTKNVMKTCQLSNEEMLKTLSSEYLILPPWTKPSYRYVLTAFKNLTCVLHESL